MKLSILNTEIISKGGPPRSKDMSQATGEELKSNTSTVEQDEVFASKLKGRVDLEVTRQGKSTLKLGNQLQIGTWNVRGMSLGKLELVKSEMERLDLDILGTCEVKWFGQRYFFSD